MRRIVFTIWLPLFLLITLFSSLSAMPPSPEVRQMWADQGVLEENMARWHSFLQRQNYGHDDLTQAYKQDFMSMVAADSEAVDTMRIPILLVEFPDYAHDSSKYRVNGQVVISSNVVGEPEDFETLLFTREGVDDPCNPTGSMTEFYWENSYHHYLIQGDVYGWFTMPETYEYYVQGDDHGMTRGALLATHAVDAAEAGGVDFSLYRGGGTWHEHVPGVVVIHAGPGAESNAYGGYGVWSHRGVMQYTRNYDGVSMSDYTMNPEEQAGSWSNILATIGVFCHEWGHILGLPDLYDTYYNPGSEGLGNWTIMAGGSWNNNGRTPAQFDAWCKLYLGYLSVVWLEANMPGAVIPQVEYNPVVYGLGADPDPYPLEFWLVENRQQVGFDEYIPGSGLCIYHVDYSVLNNDNPERYRVAMEQADGLNELAFGGSRGDADDPWPGQTDNRNFFDYSVPSAFTNDGDPSQVGVWNISDPGPTMYADLEVYYTRPWVMLTGDSITLDDSPPGGNGDGHLQNGETIECDLEVRNVMHIAYNPVVIMTTDNPDIEFIRSQVALSSHLNPITSQTTKVPIIFRIPTDFDSTLVTFTATIVADSGYSSDDRSCECVITFQESLGGDGYTDVAEGGDPGDLLPFEFVLEQNYPNPFNPSTMISYTLGPGKAELTDLSVYDILGQKVATLVHEVQGVGQYNVSWNGHTDDGHPVASGMYMYRLSRGDRSDSRKMLLVK